MTKAFQIENLEVYRTAVTLCTHLYALSMKKDSAAGAKLRETTLALILNLASGLGFWGKEWKVSHFRACKRAVMELYPLLELLVALDEVNKTDQENFNLEIQELGKKINELLRLATRREADE